MLHAVWYMPTLLFATKQPCQRYILLPLKEQQYQWGPKSQACTRICEAHRSTFSLLFSRLYFLLVAEIYSAISEYLQITRRRKHKWLWVRGVRGILTERGKWSPRRTSLSEILSTTNPTRTALGLNLGHSGETFLGVGRKILSFICQSVISCIIMYFSRGQEQVKYQISSCHLNSVFNFVYGKKKKAT